MLGGHAREGEHTDETSLDEPEGIRPGLIMRLARLFRRWKVDVVHTHNTKPLIYAAPGALLARVPADQRPAVFDRFAQLVPIPADVNRERALALDRGALDRCWNALNLDDAEWWREWKRDWRQ